jgi:predicted DNA-binding antitoxin AbrB/MazE fold protein
MQTVHAVFEQGVFRPLAPVELPEHAEVEFEPRPVLRPADDPRWDCVYKVLSRRHDMQAPDLASRHDEHQP